MGSKYCIYMYNKLCIIPVHQNTLLHPNPLVRLPGSLRAEHPPGHWTSCRLRAPSSGPHHLIQRLHISPNQAWQNKKTNWFWYPVHSNITFFFFCMWHTDIQLVIPHNNEWILQHTTVSFLFMQQFHNCKFHWYKMIQCALVWQYILKL